jgi:hypothetical protein
VREDARKIWFGSKLLRYTISSASLGFGSDSHTGGLLTGSPVLVLASPVLVLVSPVLVSGAAPVLVSVAVSVAVAAPVLVSAVVVVVVSRLPAYATAGEHEQRSAGWRRSEPPMTTVASGRWTSLPGAVDRAIGMKPSAATSAVVRTGRRRSSAAWRIASTWSMPSSCRRWRRTRAPGR